MMQAQVTDAHIYAAIAEVIPAGNDRLDANQQLTALSRIEWTEILSTRVASR
jgi:hypothetical protein